MWPREGIVIKILRGLVIRLKNGAQIMLPHQKGIGIGDTVHVLWNFHENCPAQLWTDAEYHATDEEPEPDVEAGFVLPHDWDDESKWGVDALI